MPTDRNKENPWECGVVNNASFTIGAETANAITVNIQFKDRNQNVTERVAVQAYLSDDANGDSVAASAPTSVAAGADGVYIPLVAGKHFTLISEADGDMDLVVTLSSGADTWYLVLIMPDGSLKVSGALTFAA